MINRTAARAWCHAVGAPLERRVRRSPNDEAARAANCRGSEAGPARPQRRALAGVWAWTRLRPTAVADA